MTMHVKEVPSDLLAEGLIDELADLGADVSKFNAKPNRSRAIRPRTKNSQAKYSRTEPYLFPLHDESDWTLPEGANELLEELEVLILEPTYSDDVRHRYCQIQLALNLLAQDENNSIPAPRYRQNRKISAFPIQFEADADLCNDTQLIDLHWLHCTDYSPSDDKDVCRIFGARFDIEAASGFSEIGGSSGIKVSRLNLTADQQWQLASIQSEQVRGQWKQLRGYRRKVLRRLLMASRRQKHLLGHENELADVFLAREIERCSWPSQKTPSAASIAATFQSITGKVISRQAMAKRLKTLSKHVGDLFD